MRTIALPRFSRTAAALVAVCVAALVVRLPLLPFESNDFERFLEPWYNHIADVGFAKAMSESFADYSPPYLYLLGAFVTLDAPALEAIKAVSIAFDFVLAAAIFAVVRSIRPDGLAGPVAFAAVLFAPTVVLNSALWGQCDAIYTACLVGWLALVLRGRPWLAMLLFGAAFALKVQVVFLAPALLIFTLRGRVPLITWLAVPAVYAVAIVPSWLLGRPLWDLVMLYRDQADQYAKLTLDAPNIYQWLPNWDGLATPGIWWTALAASLFAAACARPGRPLDRGRMVAIAAASALLVPFLLPHMHDRYFYPADVLTIAYAVAYPRRWYVPVLVVSASLAAYWPFLFKDEPVPLPLAAVGIFVALLVMVRDAVLGPPAADLAAREDATVSADEVAV